MGDEGRHVAVTWHCRELTACKTVQATTVL